MLIPNRNQFHVVVAETQSQVINLQPEIEDLLAKTCQSDDLTKMPLYFLGRVREKRAKPIVVAIYDTGVLAGVVYGVKHCIFGIPVGLIECGDSCGDGSILASKGYFDKTLNAAVHAILQKPFVLIARISWNEKNVPKGDSIPAQQYLNRKVTQLSGVDVWNLLRLDSSYEQFLQKLGPQTRRNMRYYRRKGEQEGWVFKKEIGYEEVSAAIKLIFPLQGSARKDQSRLTRSRELLATVPGSFFSALCGLDDEWISLIGGWVKGRTMFILVQLNNGLHAKASVSAVLRSYVIEHAIASGICEIVFIDGCEGLLKKYTQVKSNHLLVQRDDWFSCFIERAISWLFPSSTFTRLLNYSSRTSVAYLEDQS